MTQAVDYFYFYMQCAKAKASLRSPGLSFDARDLGRMVATVAPKLREALGGII